MPCWSIISFKFRPHRLVLVLIGLALVGCGEDETIRQYTVDKSIDERPQAAQQEQQMLGAIVPNKDTTWFFKLVGAPDDVSATENQFREIINSVKFGESGDPTWQLSQGWTEQRTGGITFAKLAPPDREVSATVTQLASPPATDDSSWQSWVLANVNRWRKQLALSDQDWSAMQSELQELQSLNQGESRAYYVSLRGKGSGQMGGPFSGGPFSGGPSAGGPFSNGQPGPPMMPSSQAPRSAAPELTYAVPPGWEQGQAGGMRMATFQVKQGEQQAEVTVIAAGGDERSNVARWQRQLVPDADEAKVDAVMAQAEKVEVNGVAASVYTIKGAEGPEQSAFLAAIVPWQPSSQLFIKFIGPAQLAERERDSFVTFVKSIKW